MVANVPWQKEGTRPITPAARPPGDGRGGGRRRARPARPGDQEIELGGPSLHGRHAGRAGRASSPAPSCSRSSATTPPPASPPGSGTTRWSAARTMVVVDRPGEPVRAGRRRVDWIHVEVPRLEVSSTDLRARFVDGRPLDYLVTEPVLDVIAERGLYGRAGVTALPGRRRRATLVAGIAAAAAVVVVDRADDPRRPHALQLDRGADASAPRDELVFPRHADRRDRRRRRPRAGWRRSPCSWCSRPAAAAAS